MARRTLGELGAQLGVMPFDAYTITPQLTLGATKHFSDTFGAELRDGDLRVNVTAHQGGLAAVGEDNALDVGQR